MRKKRVIIMIIINYGYCLRPVPAIGIWKLGADLLFEESEYINFKASFSTTHRRPTDITTNPFQIFIVFTETDTKNVCAK